MRLLSELQRHETNFLLEDIHRRLLTNPWVRRSSHPLSVCAKQTVKKPGKHFGYFALSERPSLPQVLSHGSRATPQHRKNSVEEEAQG